MVRTDADNSNRCLRQIFQRYLHICQRSSVVLETNVVLVRAASQHQQEVDDAAARLEGCIDPVYYPV